MNWNIAQAKQRFSEVVKQAIQEPQLIYNRNQPVAAVVNADDFAAFEAWRSIQARPRTLADEMAELQQLMQEEGFADGLELPPRTDRPNAFEERLKEECDELSR